MKLSEETMNEIHKGYKEIMQIVFTAKKKSMYQDWSAEEGQLNAETLRKIELALRDSFADVVVKELDR